MGVYFAFLLRLFPGSTRIPPCPGGFSCDNRTCVNTSRVCNGIPDCPRGEDELLCGESAKISQKYFVHDIIKYSNYSNTLHFGTLIFFFVLFLYLLFFSLCFHHPSFSVYRKAQYLSTVPWWQECYSHLS